MKPEDGKASGASAAGKGAEASEEQTSAGETRLDIERFFNLSRDMLCIAGTDGMFKRVNPAFERALGWTTEQLLSRPFADFVHPDDRDATAAEVDKKYEAGESADETSMRVIADHSRATAFLVADGVQPSNTKRGYVLRRIMRRAIRHGRRLGFDDLFFDRACLRVVDRMKDAYPDLDRARSLIEKVAQTEETTFRRTLDNGLKLLDAGASAVMPLAAPIGSGLGIRNPFNLRIILEQVKERAPDVPVIVDAGVGTASDAARAMEMGVDGVLMNTAIAGARDPRRMAAAMRQAIEAGRNAWLAGRIAPKLYATASSPLDGLVSAL